MATSMNRTIDTAGSRQSNTTYSSLSMSFAGFTYGEIHSGAKWQVIPKSKSTTIAIDKDLVHEVLYHIRAIHGPPEDKGSKGLIFRSLIPIATVTVYVSTAIISVQGSDHVDWVKSILPQIDRRIDDDNGLVDDNFSNHSYVESDSDSSISLFPITSTPRNSIIPDPTEVSDSVFTSPQLTPTPDIPPVEALTSTTTRSTGTEHSEARSIGTQYGETLNCYKSLLTQNENVRKANQDLKQHNNELKSELKELRELHTQLARSFNDLCERNGVLQAKLDSLSEKQHHFTSTTSTTCHVTKPANTTQSKQPTESTIPLQNSFSTLRVEDFPPLPSAPNSSHVTPPFQRNNQQAPRPRRKSSRPEGPQSPPGSTEPPPPHNSPDPDIIIFSNSMCARVRPRNFYRGKTTKVIARSGANIPDIQKLVTDFQGNTTTVKCVILQAWTNSTARETIDTCDRQSRALIEATLAKFPSAHIIISGVLPRFYHDNGNRVSKQLNHIFARNARASLRVSFVDNAPTFLNGLYIDEDLFWDNVHLNNQGLYKLMQNLRKIITDTVFPHNRSLQGVK